MDEMTINVEEIKEQIEKTKDTLSLENGENKAKPKKEKRNPQDDYFPTLKDAMDHSPFCPWPTFVFKCYALIDVNEEYHPFIINEQEKALKLTTKSVLSKRIQEYMGNLSRQKRNPKIALSSKESDEAFIYWLTQSENKFKMKDIKPVAQKSEDTLAFARMPFDIPNEPQNETPTFDEILSRASDPLAVECFIGSLFFPEADRQQYLWIYGEGQNGKSSLATFLSKILTKEGAVSVQPPPKQPGSNRFWSSSLLGKRLAIIPDTTDYEFPEYSLFKAATGGDTLPAERKNIDSVDYKPICKFYIHSNKRPYISGGKASIRRALFCSLQELPKETPIIPEAIYNQMLLDEGPDFISRAINTYLKHCPKHEAIPANFSQVEELIEDSQEYWQAIFDSCFKVDNNSYIQPKEVYNSLKEHMGSLFNNHKSKDFKDFIATRYNFKPSRPHGSFPRYQGFRTIRPDDKEKEDMEREIENGAKC